MLPGSQLLKMRTSNTVDLGEDGSVAYLQHPITGDLIAVGTRTGEVRASGSSAFDDYTGYEGAHERRRRATVVDGERVATSTGDRIDVFDRETLDVRVTIPLGDDQQPLFLVGTAPGACWWPRRRARPSADRYRRRGVAPPSPQLPSPAARLIVTPRATIACSSYVGVAEFELATGLPTGMAIELQLDSRRPTPASWTTRRC